MDPMKLILLGTSGAGKTGSLFSLVLSGYTLVVADFDNGKDIMLGLLRQHIVTKNLDREQRLALARRIIWTTFTDKLKFLGDIPALDGPPTAYRNFIKNLESWKGKNFAGEDVDLGPVAKLGPEYFFVIDSLSSLGRVLMRFFQSANATMGKIPDWREYGPPQTRILEIIERLYGEAVNVNLAILTHVTYTNEDPDEKRKAADKNPDVAKDAVIKGYPSAIGKAVSPSLARYFNFMLYAKSEERGTATAKRVIVTQPTDGIDLKCPIVTAPRELPLATGLATLMEEWKKASDLFA